MTLGPCRALKDRTVAGLFGPNCGKPATVQTPFGPMCADCWAAIVRDTNEGKTLLGILRRDAQKKEQT